MNNPVHTSVCHQRISEKKNALVISKTARWLILHHKKMTTKHIHGKYQVSKCDMSIHNDLVKLKKTQNNQCMAVFLYRTILTSVILCSQKYALTVCHKCDSRDGAQTTVPTPAPPHTLINHRHFWDSGVRISVWCTTSHWILSCSLLQSSRSSWCRQLHK